MSSDEDNAKRESSILKWIYVGGTALVALVALVHFLVVPGIVTRKANSNQVGLTTLYSATATYLDDCIVIADTYANITNAQKEALKEIYREAVDGQFNNKAGILDTQLMVAQIGQRYPDLNGLNVNYQDAARKLSGCQQDFSKQQRLVLDNVRVFRQWMVGSFWASYMEGDLPNDNLEIRVKGAPYVTGAKALEVMATPLVHGGTAEAYANDGIIPDHNPFQKQPAG